LIAWSLTTITHNLFSSSLAQFDKIKVFFFFREFLISDFYYEEQQALDVLSEHSLFTALLEMAMVKNIFNCFMGLGF